MHNTCIQWHGFSLLMEFSVTDIKVQGVYSLSFSTASLCCLCFGVDTEVIHIPVSWASLDTRPIHDLGKREKVTTAVFSVQAERE